MTGVETFERVKKIDPEATVIMMTGYDEEDLVKKAVSAGAYTCIHKPFDMEKVVTLVETIAREKRK
jgi:two-component system response regulator (stage 0 sporulation protein F)